MLLRILLAAALLCGISAQILAVSDPNMARVAYPPTKPSCSPATSPVLSLNLSATEPIGSSLATGSKNGLTATPPPSSKSSFQAVLPQAIP